MYVVAGSVTVAERLRRTIEKKIGFPAYVVKTPPPIRTGGCSYSVKFDDRALNVVKEILSESGFSYKKIYTVYIQNGERVYNAVP